jgi:hypothetical protein
MSNPTLDILVVPTYNTKTMGIADASVYPDGFIIQAPTLEVVVPGFGLASVPFTPNDFNIINSTIVGLTTSLEPSLPLPDGAYTLRYSVTPAFQNFVEKTIYRVDQLLERFDEVFMRLDMMECDGAIKKQTKVQLSSIYLLIQGAMSAANNCATDTANILYMQASKQLSYLTKNNCGCSGNNFF